jgi:hypothetical protein
MQISADIVNNTIDLLPIYFFRIASHVSDISAAKLPHYFEFNVIQSRQLA